MLRLLPSSIISTLRFSSWVPGYHQNYELCPESIPGWSVSPIQRGLRSPRAPHGPTTTSLLAPTVTLAVTHDHLCPLRRHLCGHIQGSGDKKTSPDPTQVGKFGLAIFEDICVAVLFPAADMKWKSHIESNLFVIKRILSPYWQGGGLVDHQCTHLAIYPLASVVQMYIPRKHKLNSARSQKLRPQFWTCSRKQSVSFVLRPSAGHICSAFLVPVKRRAAASFHRLKMCDGGPTNLMKSALH